MIADGYAVSDEIVQAAIDWIHAGHGATQARLVDKLEELGVPRTSSSSGKDKWGYQYARHHPSARAADAIFKMLKRRGVLKYRPGRGARWEIVSNPS